MFEPLRWTLVHPALVHLPLGILPLALLCLALGYVRSSVAWTFAGDVAAWAGALGALAAGLFGIVAYSMVPWPGGLSPWPIVHLGLGALTVVLAAVLVVVRTRHRKQHEHAGPVDVATALAVVLVGVAAGWSGGDVLVFHAGMAVRGAGEGSLAPVLSRSDALPGEMEDAMGELRAAWASAQTTLALCLVQHPDAERYAAMRRDAARMQQLAAFIVDEILPRAEKQKVEKAAELREHATDLRRQLVLLEQATQADDLKAIAQAMGQVTGACAGCHLELRWTGR